MQVINSTNSTTAAADQDVNSLTTEILLPIVISMVVLVLALTVIILIMCLRKKCRQRNHTSTDDIVIKVMRQCSTDLKSTESTLISEIDSSTTELSRTSSVSSIQLGAQMKHSSSSHSSLSADNKEYNQTDYAKRSLAPPPPIAPRPTETLTQINNRKDKKQVKLAPSIIDNKEATLQRASNLFRSDTKAYEFYTQTKTNYEMNPSHITSESSIGKGHFGYVHEGIAFKLPTTKKRNQKVAIKTMKNSAPDSEKQEFLYEIEIMRLVNSLNHPNIIRLLGCVTNSQPYMIVLELMANGNLQRYLRDYKSGYHNCGLGEEDLLELQLLHFALDIAKGMEGIADLQLLHRDLAARNILVDKQRVCKVADFGFAKDVLNKPEYQSKSVFQRPRPIRWLPPESLFKYAHCIESDVWSFGVVLWEIITLGNLPYPGMSTREVMNVVEEGYRMPCPQHCSDDLYELMMECWLEDAEKRPNFSTLVTKIAEFIDNLKKTETKDFIINVKMLDEEEYIQTLPTDNAELSTEFARSETLT